MGMLTTRNFQTPKSGNRPDECEDACRIWWPSGDGPARIALCDGASESAFSRSWAQILAGAFVNRPLDLTGLDGASLAGWLEPCESEWSRAVPWARLPWHGEAKARAGALATLLGMTIEWAPDASPRPPATHAAGETVLEDGCAPLHWQAVAVGDCCLFIVRDDALALSFPLEESGQFNSTPSLICSNPSNNGGLWARVHQLQGECQPGDLMILASDALACWILLEHESGGRPWETLLSLDSEREWNDWVQAKRGERAMRNDDTIMITVRVE